MGRYRPRRIAHTPVAAYRETEPVPINLVLTESLALRDEQPSVQRLVCNGPLIIN